MSEPMPEWPEPPVPGHPDDWAYLKGAQYQHDRAEAAIARLRKLEKAAKRFMASELAKRNADYGCVDAIEEAIRQIGPLP